MIGTRLGRNNTVLGSGFVEVVRCLECLTPARQYDEMRTRDTAYGISPKQAEIHWTTAFRGVRPRPQTPGMLLAIERKVADTKGRGDSRMIGPKKTEG